MYTRQNFKSKKQLKEQVAAFVAWRKEVEEHEKMGLDTLFNGPMPQVVTLWQPGPFGDNYTGQDGTFSVEGPHYPEAHKWYARCTVQNGVVVKVS